MLTAQEFFRGKTAVVFDFDGTLGETIGLWNQVDVELAARLGEPRSDAAALHAFREDSLRRHALAENPYRSYCGDFGRRIGSKLTAEEIHAMRYQISRRMLREDVRLRPGAADLLKRLKAMGLRMAVATTTRKANMEIYCRTNEKIRSEIKLDEVFEGFVCAEDVDRIKPDGECYVKALALLGVSAHRAFAVEDTLAGVQAARAAGLECIGFAEPHSAGDEQKIRSLTTLFFDTPADFVDWLDEGAL